MNTKSSTATFLLGVTCFFCGAVGARIFYELPKEYFAVTWWEVLVSSTVAVVGLSVALFAALALR